MKTAPKNGAAIEVLIYHANRKYAKRNEKSHWESTARARWVSLGKTWFADALRIYQEMDTALRSYTAREMGIERIDFYAITRDNLEHWSSAVVSSSFVRRESPINYHDHQDNLPI